MLALFDSLNTIRRTVTWGRLRRLAPGLTRHTTAAEHDRIVGAIVDREPGAASAAMRAHLRLCATISCYRRSWPTLKSVARSP